MAEEQGAYDDLSDVGAGPATRAGELGQDDPFDDGDGAWGDPVGSTAEAAAHGPRLPEEEDERDESDVFDDTADLDLGLPQLQRVGDHAVGAVVQSAQAARERFEQPAGPRACSGEDVLKGMGISPKLVGGAASAT